MLADVAGSKDEFIQMAYRANKKKKEAVWPTPRANSGNGAGKHGNGGIDLQTAVKLWGTPTANDAKNSLTGSQYGRGTLTAHIVELCFPTPGTTGLSNGSGNGGQLNAEFVEWLMGYPIGYTDIDNDIVIGGNYGKAGNCGRDETLPLLRRGIDTKAVQRPSGRQGRVQQAEVLWEEMLGCGISEAESDRGGLSLEGGAVTGRCLRNMRKNREFTSPSPGLGHNKQHSGEYNDFVHFLSYEVALAARENHTAKIKDWLKIFKQNGNRWHSEWPDIPRITSGQKHRHARLKCLGNAVVPQIPQLIWGLVMEAL